MTGTLKFDKIYHVTSIVNSAVGVYTDGKWHENTHTGINLRPYKRIVLYACMRGAMANCAEFDVRPLYINTGFRVSTYANWQNDSQGSVFVNYNTIWAQAKTVGTAFDYQVTGLY